MLKGCSKSDIAISFSSSLGVKEKLIVFTQSVLLMITCCARAALIRACPRKPHTNEVSFVNICMFWVGGDVATQGIPSSRRRSKAAFFSQLRPWASASFISIYIHPSGIFIYAKSRLKPFDHGAILDHPHVTVGPGHQHGCDETKEPSLQWRQSQKVRGRAADAAFIFLHFAQSISNGLVNDNDHSWWN